MTACELAQKYYPILWNAQRIEALVAAKKLTRAEADALMGAPVEDKAHV